MLNHRIAGALTTCRGHLATARAIQRVRVVADDLATVYDYEFVALQRLQVEVLAFESDGVISCQGRDQLLRPLGYKQIANLEQNPLILVRAIEPCGPGPGTRRDSPIGRSPGSTQRVRARRPSLLDP